MDSQKDIGWVGQCPGKVILLGEYAVLEGGPAVFLPTIEQFKLEAFESSPAQRSGSSAIDSKKIWPFHPQSPAGLLIEKNAEAFKSSYMKWVDPFQTPIGVGSSSAQFLLVWQYLQHLTKKVYIHPQDELHSLLNEYWSVVGETQGLRPSGVDIACQWQKSWGWFSNKTPIQCYSFITPSLFHTQKSSPYRLALLFTGSKMKTHEHLMRLHQVGFPDKSEFQTLLGALNVTTERVIKSLQQEHFVDSLNLLDDYQRILEETLHGFELGISQAYYDSLKELKKLPCIKAAKGAGAQGGDCILIVHSLTASDEMPIELNQFIKKHNWSYFTLSK